MVGAKSYWQKLGQFVEKWLQAIRFYCGNLSKITACSEYPN